MPPTGKPIDLNTDERNLLVRGLYREISSQANNLSVIVGYLANDFSRERVAEMRDAYATLERTLAIYERLMDR